MEGLSGKVFDEKSGVFGDVSGSQAPSYLLLSLDLLEELNKVLGRERLNQYLTTEEREEFLEALVEQAVLVEITENVQECRDPKDDKVLELALNGEAQYIISGDRDLLVLHPFRDVFVITADEFLKTMESR